MLKLFLRRTSTKDQKPTVTKPAAAGELAQGELWLNNNHESPGLFARADDDSLIEFTPEKLFLQDGTDAKPRTVLSKLKDVVSAKDFGAVGDGVADDAAAIQAALRSGALVVDGSKLTYKINSSVAIPVGVTLQNIKLTAGTAGMNMVLVNNNSRVIDVSLTGTGTVSTVERGVYPAADGVSDVELDVAVSNLTVGVHAIFITTNSDANTPKRWTGRVSCTDIVGTPGASEGYGVLLSPAIACNLVVTGKSVARHVAYLSTGAKHNRVEVSADGCNNYAVVMASYDQAFPVEYNSVFLKCRNLGETQPLSSGAVAATNHCHYNTITVEHEGNNATRRSVLIEGPSGGPYPKGNKITNSTVTGQFTGDDVIEIINADGTIVANNILHAYATTSVVALRRTGTNNSKHGGYVEGNFIDAQGQAIVGVFNSCNSQPSYIGINEIRNNSTGARVYDATGGKRLGYSRRVVFEGRTASVAGNSMADTTVNLNDAVAINGRRTNVVLTGSSDTFTTPHTVIGVFGASSETSAIFRVYNAIATPQTFNFEGTIFGD
jgi:hypothetical protein